MIVRKHLRWPPLVQHLWLRLVFLLIDTISTYMQDPFEDRSGDTPMGAICRTIEINLRRQLGETDVPKPAEPEDGVLM